MGSSEHDLVVEENSKNFRNRNWVKGAQKRVR
jgi:hypothetical protein